MTEKIKKRISGFDVEVLPYIMGNLAQGFKNVEYDAINNSITALGTEYQWQIISLPRTATVETVE